MRKLVALIFLLALGAPVWGASGWVSLFDGKTLNGWVLKSPHGRGYLVEKGLLIAPADGGGNLFTAKEYANFVFQVEFRLSVNGNNGIGIRAPLEGDAAWKSMEIQILDDDGPEYKGKLLPFQYTGSIYWAVASKTGHLKKAGEWNKMEITANGHRISVKLNGAVITDANLDDVKDPDILKKHPGLFRPTGRIGLLGHKSLVEFRNLRVRELP
jgi:hypothetical protein